MACLVVLLLACYCANAHATTHPTPSDLVGAWTIAYVGRPWTMTLSLTASGRLQYDSSRHHTVGAFDYDATNGACDFQIKSRQFTGFVWLSTFMNGTDSKGREWNMTVGAAPTPLPPTTAPPTPAPTVFGNVLLGSWNDVYRISKSLPFTQNDTMQIHAGYSPPLYYTAQSVYGDMWSGELFWDPVTRAVAKQRKNQWWNGTFVAPNHIKGEYSVDGNSMGPGSWVSTRNTTTAAAVAKAAAPRAITLLP